VGEVVGQVAVDSIGDVVAAGHLGVMADNGFEWSYTGFITKRAASDGSERWTIAIPGDNVSVTGVAIGPDDSIVVVGSYAGTADFGGTTLQITESTPPDRTDTFIAKYTWDGRFVWARGLSSTAYTFGARVGVDSAGRIVTSGYFVNSTLVLDGTTYDRTGNSLQAGFIASFDQDGNSQWGHVLAGDSGESIIDLAIAPNDDVVAVGTLQAPRRSAGQSTIPTRLFWPSSLGSALMVCTYHRVRSGIRTRRCRKSRGWRSPRTASWRSKAGKTPTRSTSIRRPVMSCSGSRPTTASCGE
jgi:hypothetical protein